MKLGDLKVGEYARDNVLSHGKLRIANNNVMQAILSDFLYSDKIQSCIREICTNAWEANKQRPFKLTLPAYQDKHPQVIIRDFGPGLDKEGLENTYTVYGVSTKRHSNDDVGAFGLGSKSPLCLSDSFIVVSYNQGNKYVVSISKDSHGHYCYDILSETLSEEPSGLEVIIDIQPSQITEFCKKAETVLKWFPIAPDCNIKLNLTKPKILESGDGWQITSYDSYYYSDIKNIVLVGPVAYPIDTQHFKGKAKTVLESCRVILTVDIGDISIAPSRESLQYTKPTIEAITKVLENLHKSVEDKVKTHVAGCKSLWEARLLGKKYLDNNAFTNKILNGQIIYNGTIVDNNYGTVKTSTKLKFLKYQWESGPARAIEYKKKTDVKLHENARFALYSQGGYARARRYVEQNQDIILYVFEDTFKDVLIDEIGVLESDILDTANFPAAVRQAKAKSIGNKIQAYEFNANNKSHSYYSSYSRNYWNNKEINVDSESGYYCPIKQFDIVNSGNLVAPSQIAEFVGPEKVIGVLVNREDKVKNHTNWKHISELIKNKLDNLSSKKIYKIKSKSSKIEILMKIKNKLTNTNTPLYNTLSLAEKVKKDEETTETFDKLTTVYKKLTNQQYTAKTTVEEVDLSCDLGKYKLLQYIYDYDWTKPEVVEYINSIDLV